MGSVCCGQRKFDVDDGKEDYVLTPEEIADRREKRVWMNHFILIIAGD